MRSLDATFRDAINRDGNPGDSARLNHTMACTRLDDVHGNCECTSSVVRYWARVVVMEE
jgi:hypothetical protein